MAEKTLDLPDAPMDYFMDRLGPWKYLMQRKNLVGGRTTDLNMKHLFVMGIPNRMML